MKVAIMQPYFLPYIGYWQLMSLVDRYVILDDVNYIKRGWVNRNRILLNGTDHMVTLPLAKADAFKKINENMLADIPPNLEKTIALAYHKAPNYVNVAPLVHDILSCPEKNLARFLTNSIRLVASYIGIETEFLVASETEHDPSLKAQDMILDICMRQGATEYYNAIGGMELYSKELFSHNGIRLGFVRPRLLEYQQFGASFIPGLSILDVLMFCSKDELARQLASFEIV